MLELLPTLTGLFPTLDQRGDHPKIDSGILTIFGQITGPRGRVAPILASQPASAYCSHHQVAGLVGLHVHTNWRQLFTQIH